MKAVITESSDPNQRAEVELYWADPNKWRRTLQSDEFSQTKIVNGSNVFEEDSDDYFPLGLRTLVTAMADPAPILGPVRPGDVLFTKANGRSDESGTARLSSQATRGLTSPYGLMEFVGAAGHSVWFMDYREFKGKRVARRLVYSIDAGDSLRGQVTELEELKDPQDTLFSIAKPTPRVEQLQVLEVPEAQLREFALQPLEIIWPQVLDGSTDGETSYYLSADRAGKVREVLPVSVSVERADDSARRQIMKWKFKPVFKDGLPVQAEGILNFHFNTRSYGPSSPLTDAKVRKLATNTVEPAFPVATVAGATCSLRIAVDSDGIVIEVIPSECPSGLFVPALEAIHKWRFSPILEDGKPLPYRAQITFHVR